MTSSITSSQSNNEALYAGLYQAVKDLNSETSTSELLELITSSFYSRFQWLVDADPDRRLDPDKVFPLRESHITELYSTLRLIVHLAKINECWEAIQTTEQKEEVSRG